MNFPAGVGGRGSSGVSAVLSRTNGGIAYADVAFATKSHFSFFSVKNKAGKYQLPGSKQIKAAMDTVKQDHAGQQDLDRRSGEDGAGGLPDLHVHVHHPADEERQRRGAAEVRLLGR